MNEITRWIVINTVGSGYTQKYAPEVLFYKRYSDAEKYLRGRIKEYLKSQSYYCSIKEFLASNCITQFETNEGEFFLEQVSFE
tara:strand:+ start:253 stop:501 length:249 start_codon:yes stop_codon:yes gene_type:complete